MDAIESYAAYDEEISESGISSNLIESLQHMYDDVVEVDTWKDEAIVWRNSQNPLIEMTRTCYSKLLEWFAENVVMEQAVPKYLEMLKLESLRNRMNPYHRREEFDTKYREEGKEVFHWYHVNCVWTKNDRVLLFAEDVNESRRTEIISCAMEQNYDFIICLDGKRNAYFVYDNKENATLLPPLVCDDYEKSCEEFIRRFVISEQQEYAISQMRLQEVMRKLDQFGEHVFFEDAMDLDGEIHHKRLRFNYYNKEEKIILITRTDCTELYRKEMEQKKVFMTAFQEAKASNKSKTEFLARMSRDFRTPLNSIVGMSAIAGTHLEDAECVLDCLNQINDSSKQLLELVNEVLDMASFSGKPGSIREEEFWMEDWKRKLARKCEKAALLKHQHFTMLSEGELTGRVLGDSKALLMACENLLKKVFRNTPDEGSIRIHFKEEISLNKRYGHFRLTLLDEERGGEEKEEQEVEHSVLEHDIFEDLQKNELDICIASKIFQEYHGEIKENENNGGILYLEFYLKLTDQNTSCRKTDFQYGAMKNLDFRGKRILIAEDNAINRRILKEVLQTTGIEIREAVNGEELLTIYKEEEPFAYDMIFMDVCMPKVDGYEATKRIRQMGRPDSESIPIFGMTANAFEEDTFLAVKAGMNEYFIKPFQFDEIAESMQHFLVD